MTRMICELHAVVWFLNVLGETMVNINRYCVICMQRMGYHIIPLFIHVEGISRCPFVIGRRRKERVTTVFCLVYILIEIACDVDENVKGSFVLPVMFSTVLVLSPSSWKHVGKSYLNQTTRMTFNFVSQFSPKSVNVYISAYLISFTSR